MMSRALTDIPPIDGTSTRLFTSRLRHSQLPSARCVQKSSAGSGVDVATRCAHRARARARSRGCTRSNMLTPSSASASRPSMAWTGPSTKVMTPSTSVMAKRSPAPSMSARKRSWLVRSCSDVRRASVTSRETPMTATGAPSSSSTGVHVTSVTSVEPSRRVTTRSSANRLPEPDSRRISSVSSGWPSDFKTSTTFSPVTSAAVHPYRASAASFHLRIEPARSVTITASPTAFRTRSGATAGPANSRDVPSERVLQYIGDLLDLAPGRGCARHSSSLHRPLLPRRRGHKVTFPEGLHVRRGSAGVPRVGTSRDGAHAGSASRDDAA